MKLISKLAFGSIAVATLTGFVLYPDASEAGRGLAAWLPWADAEAAQPAQDQPGAHAPVPHCPGRCEPWALLSGVR